MCGAMSDDQRKSSEELVREANRRLRSPQDDGVPDGDSHVGDMSSRPEERLRSEAVRTVEPMAEEPHARSPYAPIPTAPVPPASTPPDQAPTTDPSQPEPAGPSTSGSRILALGIRFGIGLALFAGITFFSSLNDANRDGSGELVSAGDLDVMALQVGDCFDDPEELDEVVFDVAAVPCSEAHDNEVYSLVPVTGFATAFPGETALLDFSYDACVGDQFRNYVGVDYLDSALEVFTFTPTQESWDDGDRDVVCVLYKLDLTKLVGTARNSGL